MSPEAAMVLLVFSLSSSGKLDLRHLLPGGYARDVFQFTRSAGPGT
jgi:hypothetical protein